MHSIRLVLNVHSQVIDVKYLHLIETRREHFDCSLTGYTSNDGWNGARKVTHENRVSRKWSQGVREKGEGHILDFHPVRL